MSGIRIVAVIEAHTVTGPAKNLIRLCKLGREGEPRLDVSIVTFVRQGQQQNAFIDTARKAGIRVDEIPESSAFDTGVIGALRKTIDALQPDIIQTHGVKSHFLMRMSGLPKRRRWIGFHHGYTAVDLKMKAYNQLDRWSLRKPRRVVTVCRPFAEELEAMGVNASRIDVLPNAIEPNVAAPEKVEEMRARLGIRPGEKVLLTIGRLSQEKGQIDLIAAVKQVPDVAFRLVIAGEGPERPRLQQAAGPLGDRVIFAGHLADVSPLYGLADMFVLPSYSEGSPNVLLEAMCVGLPIVATSVGGVPETVTHEESALLTPAGDPEALAEAIGRLLHDEGLAEKLRAGARKGAAERSPAVYRRTITAIYDKVLSS